MNIKLSAASRLQGKPRIPGDKSISHRSLMFGALSEGTTEVSHLLESGDVHSTWQCLERMGAGIRRQGDKVVVTGKGLHGLRTPIDVLDCGNSGTTMRLMMGILAGQAFAAKMIGDASLSRRPMKRVADPLTQMGARFELTSGQYAPLTVHGAGRELKPIEYSLPVASAQIKSALMLAGLFAGGTTTLRGLIHSRDHTERMIPHFGGKLEVTHEVIRVTGGQRLHGTKVNVPGDISSAAFWLVAGALVRDSRLELDNVSLNPSRVGIIGVLKRMGARIETEMTEETPEPIGRLRVSGGKLVGTTIGEDEVPSLIDEIPVIAVLASQAEGRTEVRGAEELRVKESDRIEAVAKGLRAMGAKIETLPDGFVIEGPQKLTGTAIESHDDHRIAMAFSIASLVAQGTTEIIGTECVSISYPTFYDTLRDLTNGG